MFSRSTALAATVSQELGAPEAFPDEYGSATRAFYGVLPTIVAFDQVLERDAYLALPSDWLVCLTDVVASGKAVGAGRYKAVNLAGASAISAVSNEFGGLEFPFSFGGDGARFAVHPSDARLAADTLSKTSRWVFDQLKLELRVGMIPVRTIRDAGNDVLVARYGESASAQFALFMGGGVEWGESELKHGRFSLPKGSAGDRPNLTGLSCQWGPMVSKNAQILSVIVKPFKGNNDETFLKVVKGVLSLVERFGGQSPMPESGPEVRWPESGLDLAARLLSGRGPLWLRKFTVVGTTLLYWIFFKFGLKIGRYDANKYRRAVAVNSDFRKYDDGLYLTLECSSELAVAITTLLESASKSRAAKFGVFAQRRALLTCVVPSAADGKHVHFLDGEGGGYVAAAEKMKDQFDI